MKTKNTKHHKAKINYGVKIVAPRFTIRFNLFNIS